MSVTNIITERTITGVNESEDLFLDNSSSTVSNTGAVERDVEGVNESEDLFLDNSNSTVTNTGAVERDVEGVNESEDLFLDNSNSTVTNTGVTIRDIEGINESEAMFPDNTSSDILNIGESILPLLSALEYRAEYYENEADTIELLSSNGADLLSKASLIMTPTAYSDGELHSVKPIDGIGDFNFSRNSSATRINEQGLIEEVGNNIPRIDYKDNTDGALLLEPTRTNLVTYSEDFSNAAWAKSNVSITINSTTSPDGLLNGSLMTITGGTSDQRISDDVTYSGTNVFSVFAKANDSKWLSLRIGSIANKWFDLENGVLGGSTIATGLVDSFIEDFGNGWYRCGIIFTDSSTTNTRIYPAENDLDITHTSGSVYVYGAQAESSSSYATSLINTNGSAVTRLADVCNNGGNDQVINSTEGVLYAEVATLADVDTFDRIISLSDNSTTNRVEIKLHKSGSIDGRFDSVNSDITLNKVGLTASNFNKIALVWSSGKCALFINGVKEQEDLTFITFASNVLFDLSFNSPYSDADGNRKFYGNVKDVRVYNTALTDQELAALTQV